MNPAPRAAGIVLAGGRSERMGTAKAALAWRGTTLLHHIAAVLGQAVDGPVVVVGAPGQALPAVPALLVSDPEPGRGPLQGLATGLARVRADADVAFVVATDMPLLVPEFVRRVLAEFEVGAPEVVLPVARGHRQPLAAGYRTTLVPRIEALLADGVRGPGALFAAVDVRTLDDAALLADPALRAADPDLDSLVNVNDPTEYAAALARDQRR